MSAPDFLRTVVSHLEQAGIPFMLTGSVAAAWHGAGRATMDVDLVIDATPHQLHTLAASLAGPSIYVSIEAALEALEHESMFNVVETTTGWKADLIIRKARPFSQTEFARRRPVDFEGTRLWVATVEDLIIAKLEWAKLGGSSRQVEDVTAMLRIAAGNLERAYLDRWIAELGLSEEWQAAKTAGKLE